MKTMCKTKVVSCIPAFILFIMGCYLALRPHISFYFLCHLLGIIFMFYGVVKLVCYFSQDIYQLAFQFDFAMGFFSFIVGFLIFDDINPYREMYPFLIALVVLIDGLLKIQTAMDAKHFGMEKWWIIFILSIATALTALLLLLKPFKTVYLLINFLGLNLIFDSFLNFCIVLYTVKEKKLYHTSQCP